MKKRITAVLLSVLQVISAVSALFPLNAFGTEIDEDRIIGVEGISTLDVLTGTSLSSAASLLPQNVTLKLMKETNLEETSLHKAKFTKSDWELFDENAISISENKLSVTSISTKVKALTGGTYRDFVLETTLKGTSSSVDNNFGVMLRATEVTDKGADSYKGYYVGIGKNDGARSLVIGYADGSWHVLDVVNFNYESNRDYDLKIMMYGDTLAVWLDDKLMYKTELSLFDEGQVGLRTYRQLFECSDP